MNMQFVTEQEVAQARTEAKACGYQFQTPEQALAYLEEAGNTWRNPEWAARDREESKQAEINGMCEFYS